MSVRALVALFAGVPALAVAWGRIDGRLAFVLYREPKLIAAALLGWILLVVLVWRWRSPDPAGELREVLRRPGNLALAAFLAYMATTGLWVTVRENHFYELDQLLLLFALLIALQCAAQRDPAIPAVVRGALVASLAAVTVLGILQRFGGLPWLVPIDPEIGAVHPSLMGYKNPAALAVLGQVFLLAEWVFEPGLAPLRRGLAGLLLAAELAYVASLGSRTAYAALAVAALYAAVLRGLCGGRRSAVRSFAALAAGAVVFVAVVLALPATRARALSLVELATSPRAYLESDRGTYLRNTVHMAVLRPFGVGLGDWQTQYPVFRRYDRSRSFDERFQVRRAHSDHVQFLGEGGWPGLVSWLAALAVLIGGTARRALRKGDRNALWTSAQLVALVAAMATDYVVEQPYHKLQFFLVVFLALARVLEPGTAKAGKRRLPAWAAAAAGLLALAQIAYHVELARKVWTAAAMEAVWERRSGGADLERIVALGSAMAALPGHTKTLHKDWLLFGYAAHRLGDDDTARAAVRRALELHPFYPNALRLMAEVSADPAAAQRWRDAYAFVMERATDGADPAWVAPPRQVP